MYKIQILLLVALVNISILEVKAQETSSFINYININYGYAFFGTGDENGTALGVDYTRMVSKRFGLRLNYTSADASSPGFTSRYTPEELGNITLRGDGGHAVSVSLYKMLNLGVVYQVSDQTQKNILHTSAGLNYKKAKYNYPSNVGDPYQEGQVSIRHYQFVSENEIGFFVDLKYLHFIKEHFAIGFHGTMQPGGNIVSNVGVTLSNRF